MYFGKIKKQQNDRVPPEQNVTTTFPVLHYGNIPYYADMSKWTLKIFGAVKEEVTYSYEELLKMPQTDFHNDIHCVTGWSKLDNNWTGVKISDVVQGVAIDSSAKYVIIHAEEGWTTNLPIEDFLRDTSLLAHSHNGEPLAPEHGAPLRAVIPHLYFWKSAKWVRGIEFSFEDKPGFWEKNGYHNYGNPWKSQRFSFD